MEGSLVSGRSDGRGMAHIRSPASQSRRTWSADFRQAANSQRHPVGLAHPIALARHARKIRQLEPSVRPLHPLEQARRLGLGAQLLTDVNSNRGAIINYGKRYRAGLRVASTLAESAVNSLVGKRTVKKQQMHWSIRGAHMVM